MDPEDKFIDPNAENYDVIDIGKVLEEAPVDNYESNTESEYDENNEEHDENEDIQYDSELKLTDGISHAQLQQFNDQYGNELLLNCSYCTKFFRADMIVDNNENICKHCYVWSNFDKQHELSDYGFSLEDYIAQCKDEHDYDACIKADACVLCLNRNIEDYNKSHKSEANELESNFVIEI
jgi:hypothetical protein